MLAKVSKAGRRHVHHLRRKTCPAQRPRSRPGRSRARAPPNLDLKVEVTQRQYSNHVKPRTTGPAVSVSGSASTLFHIARGTSSLTMNGPRRRPRYHAPFPRYGRARRGVIRPLVGNATLMTMHQSEVPRSRPARGRRRARCPPASLPRPAWPLAASQRDRQWPLARHRARRCRWTACRASAEL